jgi:predicted transcriptional regulator
MTFLAMLLCPLTLWERVRVRVPRVCAPAHGPSPPALSQRVRALGASAMPKEVSWTCTRLEDVEKQLDDITREEAELRQQLAAMDAQKAIAEAYEAHMTSASLLLQQLQDRLADIDRERRPPRFTGQ